MSPFIFNRAEPIAAVWAVDFGAAVLVCVVALVAYMPWTRKLHLVNGVVGLALVAYAFAGALPPPPYHQNHVVAGLLLLMLCIVPNRMDQPPRAWREFYDDRV